MREKKYPENHARKERGDARMMEGVYAGPDFFAQQNPAMFQAVYAGPDFFAQQNPAMFQAAYAGPIPPDAGCFAAPPDENTKKLKWCKCCGRTIDADAKFCTECGTPQPSDDA